MQQVFGQLQTAQGIVTWAPSMIRRQISCHLAGNLLMFFLGVLLAVLHLCGGVLVPSGQRHQTPVSSSPVCGAQVSPSRLASSLGTLRELSVFEVCGHVCV